MKSTTGFSRKDHLFNRERVEYLSEQFVSADAQFDAQGFVSDTLRGFQALELKQRIVKIAITLEKYLHEDFKLAAQQIVNALPPPLDPARQDDDFGDFIFAPLGVVVVRKGAEKRHLRLSLKTLKQLTMRFSMEDAIRHFINVYPDETLQELGKWATDRNYHVTLVKKGHPPAIKHLGFSANPKIEVNQFALARTQTQPGETIEFSFEVTARQDTRLLLDYIIDFVKADGKTAPKVFKLKQVLLRSGQQLKIVKRHPLRANATTFTLYPGTHRLKLQINGQVFGELSFEML